MALGDLLTADYQIEYNNLLLGSGTPYDLERVNQLFGFRSRTSTVTRFGRHGGTPGRNYTNVKQVDIQGNLIGVSDTDFAARRLEFGQAFKSVVAPANAPYMAFRLPDDSGGLRFRAKGRPLNVDFPMTPDYARQYPSFLIRMEFANPILEALDVRTQAYTMPSDTNVINNAGNAPAHWIATLNGPCTNPVINNITTSQVISFVSMTLGVGDVLIYDSLTGRATLNGVGQGLALATGFSWFMLEPGDQSIQFISSNATTASFSLTWRDSYWIP